jgi:choline-sulfatase
MSCTGSTNASPPTFIQPTSTWTPDCEHAEQRIDKWYHNMDSLKEAGQAAMTCQLEYDEKVGYAARRQLFDYARDGDDRPFMMVASFIHPHEPYVARPHWWNLYSNDEIDLPAPVDLDKLDPHAKRIRAGIQADEVTTTEADVRNARHGYYANTSYFDDGLGRLVTTLDETGLADSTVAMVTSDHGDMLGERGNWFKMSFYERSLRVPLVIAGPGVSAGTITNAVSHVDLLPTLLDIAGEAGLEYPTLGVDIDGRSLWNLAGGGHGSIDQTFAEYTGDMTSHPMFMLRSGRYKYIHCDTDPLLLYDLITDPEERSNLAEVPEYAMISQEFADSVNDRWDSGGIREQVIASQRSRRAVHAAMGVGELTSWDYSPERDLANEYVRNHMDWAAVAAATRFPRFRE